ncbi:hypothetical protein [Nocardioides sp. W7]|uniref:hypothetical protein n=1 Tax=Nocardioides sp. W7 TaxID=2931390 RepID=UPI001FD3021A|nr:hypothetical protein [Nocardioides sp. W7]
MRSIRLVPVALLLVLATACSGLEDLPEDETFTACLEAAGVDAGSADDEEGRREAFADPAALDCVAALDDPEDRRAVLGGVFTDEQLWPVLQDWVATRTEAADAIARESGELLDAVDGTDHDDETGAGWAKEQVHENLALVVYEQANGVPASYQTWLDDPDAQQSVSQSDPLSAGSQYLNWLEDPANGDQQTAQDIRRLQDTIRETREG